MRQNDYSTNFEIYTPLEHWKPGASFSPAEVGQRVNQLRYYQDLYDGRYSPDVYYNWHREASVVFAQMLAARPPELVSATSDRFQQSLQVALNDAMIDYTRFGTALIRLQLDARLGFAEAIAVRPTYWYPINAHDDVLIKYNKDAPALDVYVDALGEDGSCQQEHRVYENQKGSLGTEISREQFSVGTTEQWREVNSATLGRHGCIVAIKRFPDTGDWGSSLYPAIAKLALAHGNQLSIDAEALRTFGLAKWLGIPAEHSAGGAYTGKGEGVQRTPEQERYENERRKQLELFADRTKIDTLPAGLQDIRLQQPEVAIDQSEVYQAQLVNLLAAATGIPARFFGLAESEAPASGTAIAWQYVRPRLGVHGVINEVAPKLRRCLMIGAILEGVSLDANVEWGNFFDDAEVDADGELTDQTDEVDDGLLQGI